MDKKEHWASVKITREADLAAPFVLTLLSGRAFRDPLNPNFLKGTVVKAGGRLVLEHHDGRKEPLRLAHCERLEFDIDPDGVDDTNVQRASGHSTKADLIGIVARVPDWARATVAKRLLPAEMAALEKEDHEKRKAQLRAAGAAVSAKPTDYSTRDMPPEAKRRAEQLRKIGKAVSARR